MASRPEKLALIRSFCAAPPHAVLFDEAGETLFDVPATKTLALKADELSSVELLEQPERHLRLSYSDGHQLALTQSGIAFAPDFRGTGPLPELPSALCFRDLTTMLQRVRHALFDHPDDKPGRELVVLLQCGIALVDGARAVGFDVGREERELEGLLSDLEKRARG
ncbi:MAG: hypothetical protein ACJ790_18870 [Myxococcaceae bacterium]